MAGEEEEYDGEPKVVADHEEEIVRPKRDEIKPLPKTKSEPYMHGPHATGYGNFVQNLFKVGGESYAATALNSYTSDIDTNLPPSLQLKLESLSANGIDNLNTMPMWAYDTGKKFSLTPDSFERKPIAPTRSSYSDEYANRYGNFKSEFMRNRHSNVPETKPKQVILDYKRFRSSPMSPHLYSDANYVHREDSRIVGSDFVMLTMRPNDNFLNKIDKTLAEARNVNSWNM